MVFYNSAEISKIEKIVDELFKLVLHERPRLLNSTKFYWLCAHIVPFLKLYKFWTYLSEGIKSVRHFFNYDLQSFSNLGSKELLFQKCIIRNYFNDTRKNK